MRLTTMEQTEFDNAEKAAECVSNALQHKLSDILPSGVPLSLLARDLITIWVKQIETIQPKRSRPAHIAGLRWVIRSDDLKLLDSILDGLKVSAGAGFFILGGLTPTGTVVAAAGLFASFLKLTFNAVSKGAVLCPRDYSVIATLFGQSTGMTNQDILDHLSNVESDWTLTEIDERLTKLSEIPCQSGKIAMVWKSFDARWRTAGI